MDLESIHYMVYNKSNIRNTTEDAISLLNLYNL